MARLVTPFAIVAVFALFAGSAVAQGFNLYKTPGSGSDRGFGGQELANLRRSAIGVGYSGSQLNQISLNRAIARPSWTGVASVDASSGQRAAGRYTQNLASGSRSAPTQRPFSNIQRRPSVSPYMGLFREGFDDNANALNYQTVVRPQVRQQQFNRAVSREAAAINQRLQSIAAQPAYNPAGSQTLAPTGLQAGTFRYYSHFYGGR